MIVGLTTFYYLGVAAIIVTLVMKHIDSVQ